MRRQRKCVYYALRVALANGDDVGWLKKLRTRGPQFGTRAERFRWHSWLRGDAQRIARAVRGMGYQTHIVSVWVKEHVK